MFFAIPESGGIGGTVAVVLGGCSGGIGGTESGGIGGTVAVVLGGLKRWYWGD